MIPRCTGRGGLFPTPSPFPLAKLRGMAYHGGREAGGCTERQHRLKQHAETIRTGVMMNKRRSVYGGWSRSIPALLACLCPLFLVIGCAQEPSQFDLEEQIAAERIQSILKEYPAARSLDDISLTEIEYTAQTQETLSSGVYYCDPFDVDVVVEEKGYLVVFEGLSVDAVFRLGCGDDLAKRIMSGSRWMRRLLVFQLEELTPAWLRVSADVSVYADIRHESEANMRPEPVVIVEGTRTLIGTGVLLDCLEVETP